MKCPVCPKQTLGIFNKNHFASLMFFHMSWLCLALVQVFGTYLLDQTASKRECTVVEHICGPERHTENVIGFMSILPQSSGLSTKRQFRDS